MSQSKSTPSSPGSDESLYPMIDSSPIHHNLETTMLQDAFATRLGNEANHNFGRIIRLEIIISLIFIGLAILVQFTNNNPVSNSDLDLQRVGINYEIRETQNQ